MRFGELIPLISALLNFSLAIFVLVQNPRATVARVYFLMGMCFSIWNFGTFWMFRVPAGPEHYGEALYWARFLQFGVIFIPLTLCHVSFLVAQIRIPRWVVWAAYSFHVALFFSNFTGFFLEGVRNVGYAWYSVAGYGFWILSGVFSLMWVSVAVLFWHRRSLPPMGKRRLTPLIIAQTAFAIFGCNDILPILGIYYYPYTHSQVYPFGSMAVIFYGLIVGYSVLQYQLLEIHVTLNRSTAKAVRVLFIFFSGLCSLLVFWLADRDEFTFYSFFAGLATLMIGAMCAALLFPRLFGENTETIERHILGDTFEYEDRVHRFIEGLTWYNDLTALLNDLHDLLARTFQLDSYYLILRNEANRLFELTRSQTAQPPRGFPELRTQSAIFRYFESAKREYLSLQEEDPSSRGPLPMQQARVELAPLQGRFCFPLSSEGEIFGLLVVGQKSSEQFTSNDISLLITLVKSLSLIVNQIRLKTQVQQALELDLLGKMSRGMAHDLNNLLTPVWTLLQLSSENGNSEPLDDELLPVALRNVATMRAYIKEALFFSENLRPDLQLGRLDLVIHQAADLAKASRKKEVEVVADTPGEALVEMDEVLVQRLIANLISNSIDASPSGSQIRVQLERLAKSDVNREWWRVRVIDQGEGIPKENLTRILTPYFTTKNRGDENRGFGLGLAICRKIVHLHGGQLFISSQPRKGTTVQFDLPSRQAKPATPAIAKVTA
ncbi:multi-sensor signal transduction histidine kinase [Chthoniobacter flavus Ellin428]|uniref:histidine kinase n=1 Tax=Chthoniobacter flavus Ellin428 TaxID=497964 RepID=B4D977_9BACT|nr:sensor histidine kinase [Chthoniobacter flavus]EDY16980.1 multi-sensor signal transduction histidine kinase [Chthoniobacter flavus Ellin428]TCO86067.1 signal transduction histidine kinase [Chthoniobacter flavus]